jgi:hypothetical protein
MHQGVDEGFMKTQFKGKEIIPFHARSFHSFDGSCPCRCNAIFIWNDILKISQALH